MSLLNDHPVLDIPELSKYTGKNCRNKPENPFQTMTSQKIADVVPPDSSENFQN